MYLNQSKAKQDLNQESSRPKLSTTSQHPHMIHHHHHHPAASGLFFLNSSLSLSLSPWLHNETQPRRYIMDIKQGKSPRNCYCYCSIDEVDVDG